MTTEEASKALLKRFKEMGINIHQSIYRLTWVDVARIMAESDDFTGAAGFPTEVLLDILNTVTKGLESLDWSANIESSLALARERFPQDIPEDAHLEGEYEDRVGGMED